MSHSHLEVCSELIFEEDCGLWDVSASSDVSVEQVVSQEGLKSVGQISNNIEYGRWTSPGSGSGQLELSNSEDGQMQEELSMGAEVEPCQSITCPPLH